MKKYALLMLLPFAIVATGCSGSLKKSSIFTEKFLKLNSLQMEEKYEFEVQNDVVLNLGEGVTPEQNASYDDILDLSKTDGSKGFYNLSTRTFALPVDAYKAGTPVVEESTGPIILRMFAGAKEVEGKDVIYVYDEYGTQIYTGKYGALTVSSKYAMNIKEDVWARLDVFVGAQLAAHAFYTIDWTLKEVLTPDQFYAKYPYSFMGENLIDYGHEELIERTVHSDGETRYFEFNTKKEKYVSSFTIPDAINGDTYRIGDYIYYQILTDVNERETKYDFAPTATTKKNVDTYRVNYTNGKVESVKTNFLFNSFTMNSRELISEKGIAKYYFLSGVRHFEKDKSLSPIHQNFVVDEKFNVVADVSGIDLSELTQFGDNFLIGNTVYDSKLREIGFIQGMQDADEPRIVKINGFYGLVDHTGKYLVKPVYEEIEKVLYNEETYALSKDKEIKLISISEKEEVKEIKTFTTDEYAYDSQTASFPHVIFEKKEDSKFYVLNCLDGTFTPIFEFELSDVPVCFCDSYSAVEGKFYTDANVFKRGETYHAIYNSTKTTNSIPEIYTKLFK